MSSTVARACVLTSIMLSVISSFTSPNSPSYFRRLSRSVAPRVRS